MKKVTEEQIKRRWQELQEVQGYTDEELPISRSEPGICQNDGVGSPVHHK
jgi:hypothetical protein